MKLGIITIILLISYAHSNICKFRLGNFEVDLNPLKQSRDITLQADGFYDIIYNFCTTISYPPTCNRQSGKTAYHVHWQNIEECNWIGGSYTPEDVEISFQENPKLGVNLRYKNGERFSQGGVVLGSETLLQLNCNKDVELSPIIFISNNQQGDKIVYLLLADSKHACPHTVPNKCTYIKDEFTVDLNPLSQQRDLSIQADGFYNVKLNFCKPVTTPLICSGQTNKLANRVYWQNDDDCNWIGGGMDDIEVTFANPSNPRLGVILQYKNGQEFNQGGQLLGSETRIGIACDPTTELTRVTYHGVIREGNKMVYSFRSGSKHACPKGVSKICELTESGYFVNLNPLKRDKDIFVQADGFYDAILNFCKPVTNPPLCDGKNGKMAHHVHWQNHEECNWIGGDFTEKDVELKFMDNREAGVILFYKNGQEFNQGGNRLGSETRIMLFCDHSIEEFSPIVFQNNFIEGNKMVYLFRTSSKYACHSISSK